MRHSTHPGMELGSAPAFALRQGRHDRRFRRAESYEGKKTGNFICAVLKITDKQDTAHSLKLREVQFLYLCCAKDEHGRQYRFA